MDFLSEHSNSSAKQRFLAEKLFHPVRPSLLQVERIVLAKGSLATATRREYVKAVCSVYPEAPIVEMLDVPHNKIKFSDPHEAGIMHDKGKKTLVFGVHNSALRFSREEGNTCPNYWHFSPTGYCFFDCKYCYLAGTPGIWHSPTIKIFVNVDEILDRIDAVARNEGRPIPFYLGKLQDGLALDPLTGYSAKLIPFFARHSLARQIILTKTDEVEQLLDLEHNGNTILSWSLNPQKAIDLFEENSPSLNRRLAAMKRCAASDYPVRAVVMPLIPIPDWQAEYATFIRRLLEEVPLQRLTLGGICSYAKTHWLMEQKIGADNAISAHIDRWRMTEDGRARYPQALRIAMYSELLRVAREIRPELETALCLEEVEVWQALGLEKQIGKCNCVL